MPVSIVATPGASNANSYVTIAEADAYMAGRLNASAWTTADTDTRSRALIEAQRNLTPLLWVGSRVTDTQALAWPRAYAPNPDAPAPVSTTGRENLLPRFIVYYGDTVVPQRVKDAQVELALEFLKSGTADLAVVDGSFNITREKVDVLEVEYSDPSLRAVGLAKYTRVMSLVTPLFVNSGSGLSVVRA